jgi:hypothetical protein
MRRMVLHLRRAALSAFQLGLLLVMVLVLFVSHARAASIPSTVKRSLVSAMERNIDKRLDLMGLDEPFLLLGPTRGIYLDGYGAVFTSELNLIASANISPFRPKYTPEELQRLKQKKAARLESLKKNMREMLINTASAMDTVPADERITLGITLFYYSWEDSSGLPRQVIMSAPKKVLVAALKGDTEQLDSSLRLQELH